MRTPPGHFTQQQLQLRPSLRHAEGWACWRRLSHFVRSYIYRTNLVGSAELINAALKANVSCFVFTSSIAVYGAGAGAGALSVRAQAQPQALLTRVVSRAGADGRGHITSGGATLTEEDTPSPEDPYAVSKYATELDLRAAKEMFGMDFVIFRPHNVYGPRQNLHDAYRVSAPDHTCSWPLVLGAVLLPLRLGAAVWSTECDRDLPEPAAAGRADDNLW